MEYAARFAMVALLAGSGIAAFGAQSFGEEQALKIKINPADGKYTIAMPGSDSYALHAGAGVEVDGRWLHASDYPRHEVSQSQTQGIWAGDRLGGDLLRNQRAARPDSSPACLFGLSLSPISR